MGLSYGSRFRNVRPPPFITPSKIYVRSCDMAGRSSQGHHRGIYVRFDAPTCNSYLLVRLAHCYCKEPYSYESIHRASVSITSKLIF